MLKQKHTDRGRSGRHSKWVLSVASLLALGLAGCEMDSWFNQATLGRWEATPVVLPILDQIDLIDELPAKVEGYSEVLPEDLIPDVAEYVIGVGDMVSISVFELRAPGSDAVETRRVDELGMVRLPVIGPMKITGKTPSQLETEIAASLSERNILKDATVSVIVQEGRQKTYSVIGEAQGSEASNVGVFQIPKNDFRMLEAIAQARGVPGSTKRIYVIREVRLDQPRATHGPAAAGKTTAETTPTEPVKLLEEIMKGLDTEPAPMDGAKPDENKTKAPTAPEAPPGLNSGLDDEDSPWAYVDGKWVRVEQGHAAAATQPGSNRVRGGAVQRVIEVPYSRLIEGDLKYNIVIRPGDVIRVPAPVAGNVFLGGQIARPGTYALPGGRELTLKQLIFAAGGLQGLAEPGRIDLIRRIDDSHEATIRLSVKAIFDGTQPDFFLKPNDSLNFGTSFIAYPISVIREGFRYSFGFGFVLDKNFSSDVFGNDNSNNNNP
ncbi:MAG: polysaccharide biosynthesis/export family protein [Planctomycetes bacterium]|nr:polysaccharide biosynthesis/export family protein [Planctomycetota bacterium]